MIPVQPGDVVDEGESTEESSSVNEELKVEGTITALSDTSVTVDETVILITADTEIDGTPALGAKVKVDAVMAGDVLTATKIKVGIAEELNVEGTITAVSDTSVTVDETVILITADTEIDGTPALGAKVKVDGVMAGDVFTATKIKVEIAEELKVEGTITALTDTSVTVDETVILITADTEIDGTPALGAKVKVDGVMAGDVFTATKIKVEIAEELKVEGTITALTDTSVTVDETVILITADTEIDGTPALGAKVKVDGVMAGDDLTATKI